jgi:hypothetical protein
VNTVIKTMSCDVTEDEWCAHPKTGVERRAPRNWCEEGAHPKTGAKRVYGWVTRTRIGTLTSKRWMGNSSEMFPRVNEETHRMRCGGMGLLRRGLSRGGLSRGGLSRSSLSLKFLKKCAS